MDVKFQKRLGLNADCTKQVSKTIHHPSSFNIVLNRPQDYLLVFQYFSFVTITTLGYGDITPVTEVAKAITVLEAVAGQLYLVVAVAWLVGMYVSKKAK